MIFLFILIILLIAFLYYIYKKGQDVIDASNSQLNEIKDEIELLSTVEDCEALKEKIKINYENTDIIFKNIKNEYIHLYYIVIGVEKTIKKLIKSNV